MRVESGVGRIFETKGQRDKGTKRQKRQRVELLAMRDGLLAVRLQDTERPM